MQQLSNKLQIELTQLQQSKLSEVENNEYTCNVTHIPDILTIIELNKNSGIELTVNDTVNFGVGPKVYAYVRELIKAKVNYTPSTNTLFGYITKTQTRKLLGYLEETDGYLNIN